MHMQMTLILLHLPEGYHAMDALIPQKTKLSRNACSQVTQMTDSLSLLPRTILGLDQD